MPFNGGIPLIILITFKRHLRALHAVVIVTDHFQILKFTQKF